MTHDVATWLDHKEARIFQIDPDGVEETTVTAPLRNIHHKHPKGPEGVKEHPDDAKRFFQEVARSLEGADRLLIMGPSTAKLEFVRYVRKNERALAPKIVGVETVDHPTDVQLVAHARKSFLLLRRS